VTAGGIIFLVVKRSLISSIEPPYIFYPLKSNLQVFYGGRRSPTPPIGAGGGQDFLATGCGQWYRGIPSDQTTGLEEEAGGFINGYRSH
jgi:hypothetical protein